MVVAVAAEHWVKVGQRKPEKHKVDQDGETDFVFFLFLSSSVQPRLKLLQLWTAHQSANRIFCLNRISPPCCEGGAGSIPALRKIRHSVAFSCCVCSVCTTSFLCLSPCDCTCWVA